MIPLHNVMSRKMYYAQVGKQLLTTSDTTTLSASDYMDDGTIISCFIDIDVEKGSAVVDFR